MPEQEVQITRLKDREEAEKCAKMMEESEPWIRLRRGYKESLDIILDQIRETYLAHQHEQIVGFLILEMLGTFKGYIKSVYVSPEKRGKGIGTKLIKYVEDRVFSETPNMFLLVSSFNHKARKLYSELGYVEVGEFTDFIIVGYSEILMRKTIGPLSATVSPESKLKRA